MRTPQEIKVPQIRYLGEQDGEPERALKQRLYSFYKHDRSVRSAYLARVELGDASHKSVALCMNTEFGPDRGLVEKIGVIFATVFNAHEHLDLVFLDELQESELAKVCKPFFTNK